jgi:hypothetical protein
MFLRNWYRALTAEMYNHSSVTGINTSGLTCNIVGGGSSGGIYSRTSLTMTGGSSLSSSNTSAPNMGVVQTDYAYKGGIVFGTGSAEPTFDDYRLSGDLITTISSSASVTATLDDDGCTFVGTYTLTNTGSDGITVKEIGLLMSNNSGPVMLIERTVLDEPVTIPAGGVGQVTYTIRFNYPTA